MLQSVSFPVAGTEVLAILHLPSGEATGAMALLCDRGMQYEHPDVLLTAHPALPGAIGVAGFGFGAAVAAVAAGRDSRVKVAVLGGVPAEVDGSRRPLVEVTRTRARVLIVRGEDADDADRYGPVLSQARVTHRLIDRDRRDHMVREIASWAKEAFSAT